MAAPVALLAGWCSIPAIFGRHQKRLRVHFELYPSRTSSAIEEYVPNARNRLVPGTLQIGTPLTHERFLRRSNGAYGPRVVAGKHTLPGHKTPLEGLLMCGDYTFPGIGVPATAASGAITANNLVSVQQHWAMLDKISLPERR